MKRISASPKDHEQSSADFRTGWYVKFGGTEQAFGPLPVEAVRAWLGQVELHEHLMFWHPSWKRWHAAAELESLFEQSVAATKAKNEEAVYVGDYLPLFILTAVFCGFVFWFGQGEMSARRGLDLSALDAAHTLFQHESHLSLNALKDVQSLLPRQPLKICNETSSDTLRAALAYFAPDDGVWRIEGWYTVEQGQCVMSRHAMQGPVFGFAVSVDDQIAWQGRAGEQMFCVHGHSAFTFELARCHERLAEDVRWRAFLPVYLPSLGKKTSAVEATWQIRDEQADSGAGRL